jgi:lipopolysaccharide/colanic/teichoic acid biosynthesis glycosyltransferase
MDLVVSLLLLPPTILIAMVLLVLNPFYNPGSLFYVQTRLGRNCKPFKAVKFRTMRSVSRVARSPDDPVETHRITPLGGFLRKSRIDELPQILNVLRGDMSLIGPRPDYINHARRYIKHIPGYRERHLVRPGISGLAQTECGYAEGYEATARKVKYDLYYIANTGLALELWIFWRTLTVVAKRGGS